MKYNIIPAEPDYASSILKIIILFNGKFTVAQFKIRYVLANLILQSTQKTGNTDHSSDVCQRDYEPGIWGYDHDAQESDASL